MLRSLRSPIPVAPAMRSARPSLVVIAATGRRKAGIVRQARKSITSSSSSSCLPSSRPLLLSDVACHASTNDNDAPSSPPPPPPPSPSSPSSPVDLLGSVVALALWAAFVLYALKFSPNQTPARDLYFLQKLIPGSGAVDDGVAVNGVFYALFNAMGVMPALYASVLIPAGRSRGKLPAWPFVAGSFAFGFFALGPYLALWTPAPAAATTDEEKGGPRDAAAPPPPEALQRNGALGGVFLRALESPITAAVLFVAAAAQVFIAATAGKESWVEFFRLFDESRFVHVTSLDFLTLSALLPFWAANDAAARKFDVGGGGSGGGSGGGDGGNGGRGGGNGTLAAAMACFPLIGPALYLVLRPKAKWAKEK